MTSPSQPQSRPQRRTQAERRAAAESALLEAAAELIVERGPERASLRSIGVHAGVSREMPAYHFGSKDALLTRLVDRAQERTLAATAEALTGGGRRTDQILALDALRITIETYLERFTAAGAPEERAVLVMWGANFPTETPIPAAVETDRRTHHDLARTIRTGQLDGSVDPDVSPEAAAVLVMGMARGVAAVLLAQPEAADAAEVRRLCDQVIANALRT